MEEIEMKWQKSNIEFNEHNKLFENSPSIFLEKLKTKNNKSINANETFDSDQAIQFRKNICEKPHHTPTNSLWIPIINEKCENIPEQVEYCVTQSTLKNVLKNPQTSKLSRVVFVSNLQPVGREFKYG